MICVPSRLLTGAVSWKMGPPSPHNTWPAWHSMGASFWQQHTCTHTRAGKGNRWLCNPSGNDVVAQTSDCYRQYIWNRAGAAQEMILDTNWRLMVTGWKVTFCWTVKKQISMFYHMWCQKGKPIGLFFFFFCRGSNLFSGKIISGQKCSMKKKDRHSATTLASLYLSKSHVCTKELPSIQPVKWL